MARCPQPQKDYTVAWKNTSPAGRPDVRDYRYSSRLQDAVRTVPRDSEYPGSQTLNQAAQVVCIADAATVARRSPSPTRKPSSPSGTTSSFRSKQDRLAQLPTSRLNDMRLSRSRSDEDPGALGPGTYAPQTSCGGPRRKTYRLFEHLDSEAAIGLPSRARTASGSTADSQHPPWPWMPSCLGQRASSAFMSGSRSRAALNPGINTDSKLLLKR